MKSKNSPIFLVLLVLLLASLACQSLTGEQPAEPSAPVDSQPTDAGAGSANPPAEPVEPAPESAPEIGMPDPIQPQGPGIACFGLQTGGLSCLSESGWQTLTSENSGLPSNYLQAGGLCPDGRIVFAHYDGLSLFDGANWENVPKTDNYSSADAVSCAADGSLWVAHFKGVSRYANGEWTTFGSELLASGEFANDLVYDVAASPDGRVWAVTSRSVAVFENDAWDIFQEGQGFSESVFFDALALDSLNRPWAGLSSGAATYDGTWKIVSKPGYASTTSMAFDASGRLWMGTLSDGVSAFNGNTWSDFNRKTGQLPADHVNDIAADSLGRVWVATTYGLVVFDGDTSQVYRMDNSELGDNNIKFAVVVKDGPPLPATVEKQTGSLVGSLEMPDGSPLAGMRVEICVESLGSQFSGDTPCSDQPFFLFTETDENGAFRIENVPAGYYVLVADTGDGWAQLTTEFGFGSERTPILSGDPTDIGTLTLEE